MLHILETRPTKVRWCWLARERGTSTAPPLSTVLVLRVATLGGCRNPARCGTPCTCALWNTTSPATFLWCSSESRGLADSGWAGGFCSIHQSQGSTLDAIQPPSVQGCTRHPGEGSVLYVRPYLDLVEQELPSPVEEAGYPSQDRDPVRGLFCNVLHVAVKP
ncbi:hypothetical protein GWK47_045011 [Chionoecetes opilio]|uniref:Uncharacterized protein n=1 Tax=Chionoecetes opilio TaxID=41210 RepID=A0A8J4Y8M6_CHIOP|nr:hypothetical protein GWK47_045011 [Chionoecetes opilio]